jgi:D-alanine-D-alanine ligase
VSIASGAQTVLALEAAGHDVVALDTIRGVLGPADRARLPSSGIAPTPPVDDDRALARRPAASVLTRTSELREVDLVFVALHGGSGEDGTLQALLDPRTGPAHLAILVVPGHTAPYTRRAARP